MNETEKSTPAAPTLWVDIDGEDRMREATADEILAVAAELEHSEEGAGPSLPTAQQFREMLQAHFGDVAAMVARHEAKRLRAYDDITANGSARGVSIGIGRNLNTRGITDQEAFLLFWNDMAWLHEAIPKAAPTFSKLNEPRQAVLIDMGMTLGPGGLKGFTGMQAALEREDWVAAALEMGDSLWYGDVGGNRAARLVVMMLTGKWEADWSPVERALHSTALRDFHRQLFKQGLRLHAGGAGVLPTPVGSGTDPGTPLVVALRTMRGLAQQPGLMAKAPTDAECRAAHETEPDASPGA